MSQDNTYPARYAPKRPLPAAPPGLLPLGDAVWRRAAPQTRSANAPYQPRLHHRQPLRRPALDQRLQGANIRMLRDQRPQAVEVTLADGGERLGPGQPAPAAARGHPREQAAADRVALEQAVPGGAEHGADRAALALRAAVVDHRLAAVARRLSVADLVAGGERAARQRD